MLVCVQLQAPTAVLIPSRDSELSYTTVAMEREHIVYSSLLTLAGAVLADPERMLARLVRGCIALAFTASVPADQSSHRLAEPVKGSELSYMTLDWRCNACQLRTDRC